MANRIRSDELASAAIGWLGVVAESDADFPAAKKYFEESLARAPDHASAATALFALFLYQIGEYDRAVEIARKSVDFFHARKDTYSTMFGYPHLGMALAARGRYDEALVAFKEAWAFGDKYGVERFLARSIAMSAGLHLDLFDFQGHEKVAREAMEYGQTGGFPPAVTSASIDLIFNYGRTGELGPTEGLLQTAIEATAKVQGWHAWLWKLRLTQARGEICLARGEWKAALEIAEDALRQARTCRPKYQVLATWTRGQALHGLGRTKEAIAALQAALERARLQKDPALFLRVASTLLAVDGDDQLLTETRGVVEGIRAALTEPVIRASFEDSENVRQLSKF